MQTIRDAILATQRLGPEDLKRFHEYREVLFDVATDTFNERKGPYGEFADEFAYGLASAADELWKRAKRSAAMCNPIRTDEVTALDLTRIENVAIDIANFASALYALSRVARKKMGLEQ